MSIILAIDPGYDRCGIALLKKEDGKESLIFSECFTTDRKESLDQRIFSIGTELEQLIMQYKPQQLAIENVYFQNNQKTIIGISEMKGVCKYIAHKHNLDVFEYTPLQIKTAITGNGKSSKDQIAWMVPKLINYDFEQRRQALGGTSSGIDDEIDAIAIGLTHYAYFKKNL